MKYLFVFSFLLGAGGLAAQAPPCDTTANCCADRCAGAGERCLCDCLFAGGQSLRRQERYGDAVKYFEAVARLCPEYGARTVIDSIYREHRIWVYGDGKFAVATPLGEPLTPFLFSNPEPFRKGVAIFSENDKYFFVDREGRVLTPQPGYDAIIRAEGNVYALVQKYKHSFTTESGRPPVYWREDYISEPFELPEIGPWGNVDSLKLFFDLSTRYDQVYEFHSGLFRVLKNEKWGFIDQYGKEIIPPELDYEFVGDFYDGRAQVMNNEEYGYIDQTGQLVIPLQYSETMSFQHNMAWVRDGWGWALIDTNGRQIIEPGYYTAVKRFHEGKAAVNILGEWSDVGPFNVGGKWGFIDTSGKEIISPRYDYVEFFKNGLVQVELDDKWGLIDASGQEVIPPKYTSFSSFQEGLARVSGSEYKNGVVDTAGNEIIAPKYDEIGDFINGVSSASMDGKWGLIDITGREIIPLKYDGLFRADGELIWLKYNGKWGLFDKTGRALTSFRYDEVAGFQNNLGAAGKNGRWRFLDRNGCEIINFREYDYFWDIGDGMAKVSLDHKWGLIDRFDCEVISPKYFFIDQFDYDYGVAWVNLGGAAYNMYGLPKDGKWGLIDKAGRELISPTYDHVHAFKDGVAWVNSGGTVDTLDRVIGGKWGLVDSAGREIIVPKYDFVQDYAENGAWACVGGILNADNKVEQGKWYLIDKSGREIGTADYDAVYDFREGVAFVEQKGLWGIIDKSGREIVEPQYDFIREYRNDMAVFSKEGKDGFLDKAGRVVIPPKYHGIGDFKDGIANINLHDQWGIIDTTGREIIPPVFDEIRYDQGDEIIRVRKDSLWGLADMTGQQIIAPQYHEISIFIDDFAEMRKNNKLGLIGKNGREVIPPLYDNILPFQDEVFRVKQNGLWGLVDVSGRIITPFQYENIKYVGDNNLAIIQKDGKKGFINKEGREVVAPVYDFVENFENGMAIVINDKGYGYIDTNGNEIVSPRYAVCWQLDEPLYRCNEGGHFDIHDILVGGLWGVLDNSGRTVVPFFINEEFGQNEALFNQIAPHVYLMRRFGKKGLLFADEKTYIPPEYDEIAQPYDAWVMVMKNNKWGWVDHRGNVMIPCRYDAATPFDADGRATVLQFGFQFRINREGEMIWEK